MVKLRVEYGIPKPYDKVAFVLLAFISVMIVKYTLSMFTRGKSDKG